MWDSVPRSLSSKFLLVLLLLFIKLLLYEGKCWWCEVSCFDLAVLSKSLNDLQIWLLLVYRKNLWVFFVLLHACVITNADKILWKPLIFIITFYFTYFRFLILPESKLILTSLSQKLNLIIACRYWFSIIIIILWRFVLLLFRLAV